MALSQLRISALPLKKRLYVINLLSHQGLSLCSNNSLYYLLISQVEVEEYGAGSTIDLEKLDGTWRLNYTSAGDVVVLFEAASRLPFLQVL